MNSGNIKNTASAETDINLSNSQNITRFFRSFKRLWWVSAICCVVFAAVTFAYYSITYVPKYRSEVKFTIMPLVSSDASNGASVYNFNYNQTLAQQMSETFPYVINSGIMNDIITNDLQRPFKGNISAKAVTNTNIFEITAISTSAQDAYDIINSVINNYPKVAEYIIGDTRMSVLEGSEPTLATTPYNKGYYYIYVVYAGILGIIIGILASAIDMHYRKIIVNKNDIETYFNGKCVCEVPEINKKRSGSSNGIIKASSSLPGFAEPIRVLKQRARNTLTQNGTKIIGITSSSAGECKTTVAYNLARALSNGDSKVLLLDMNLHNRDIQTILNRKKTVPNLGITDVAANKIAIDDVINSISDTLDVIFAGEANEKFKKSDYAGIFDILREQYSYIIVDMSTCDTISETVQVADLCDEILFVVRANWISPEKVYSSLKDLAFSDANLMGFVLNFTDETNSHNYYGRYGKRRYGYGYNYNYSRYSNYGSQGLK